jgi:putative DNA primase/helicase
MIAAEIARALGAARRSGQWWRSICPVHGSRSGHSATLALREGARGLIVYCHAGCIPADILVELRRLGLLDSRDRPDHTGSPAPNRREHARRIEIARRIWTSSRDARGSPVVQYLAGRDLCDGPPRYLRWVPRCWHRETCAELPAMLARIDGPDGALIGVHRTYLQRDERGQWHRRDRASLGPIAGGAVRLGPAAETLIIAEGIETTLATMIATGLSGWAALSTSGLVALILPPLVGRVIIAADHDASGAGERAAAARWLSEGRRVRIAMPPEPDTDMADVLARGAYARNPGLNDVAA